MFTALCFIAAVLLSTWAYHRNRREQGRLSWQLSMSTQQGPRERNTSALVIMLGSGSLLLLCATIYFGVVEANHQANAFYDQTAPWLCLVAVGITGIGRHLFRHAKTDRACNIWFTVQMAGFYLIIYSGTLLLKYGF